MPRRKSKSESITVQKGRKMPKIDGLEDFPLEVLGLTPKSIEESNGGIFIPRELMPYIKVCKAPKLIRDYRKTMKERYLLRLKAEESRTHLKRKRKSPKKGGKH